MLALERHGHVLRATLDRPPVNAIDDALLAALEGAVQQAVDDQRISVLHLRSAQRTFCAGADLAYMRDCFDREHGTETMLGMVQRMQRLFARLEAAPLVTLAEIGGAALGGGFELALACDLRIAADDAKLTTAFAKVGLAGDYGGSYFLNHLVGAAKARELYFTAEVLSGAEAQRIGLVNRAVPAALLPEAARTWAAALAALPTVALGYMKRNLNTALHGSLADVLDAEAVHMVRTFDTEDHKAAALAFVDKRVPQFKGR